MVDLEEENLATKTRIRSSAGYVRTSYRPMVRLNEKQQEMLSDFAVEFGLNVSDAIRACIAACLGAEEFFGPDDKISVVQAAVYLAGGEES